MKLTVVITQGEEMLVGQIREVPGVVTQGKSVAEVLENVRDALEVYFMESDKVPQPNDSELNFDQVILTQELEFA